MPLLVFRRGGGACSFGIRSSIFGVPWSADFAQDAVVNPVLVPPFFGIYLIPSYEHAEVHVITESHAGGSADADLLLFLHHVPHFHGDAAHVPVEALE